MKKNTIPEITIPECVTDDSVMLGFWEATEKEQNEIDNILAEDFDFK